MAKLDDKGHEILDPTPLSLPVGFKRPETLAEQVQRLVRQAGREAEQHGFETFEEADDFDIEDDVDIKTPYEMEFDPVLGREISPEMILNGADNYYPPAEQEEQSDDAAQAAPAQEEKPAEEPPAA